MTNANDALASSVNDMAENTLIFIANRILKTADTDPKAAAEDFQQALVGMDSMEERKALITALAALRIGERG